MPHANEAAYPGASSQVKTLVEIAGSPRTSHPMLVDAILSWAPTLVGGRAGVALLTRQDIPPDDVVTRGRTFGGRPVTAALSSATFRTMQSSPISVPITFSD